MDKKLFIYTPLEVIKLVGDDKADRILSYICMTIRTTKTHEVFITDEQLKEVFGYSQSTITRKMEYLVDKDFIEVQMRDKRYIHLVSTEIAELQGINISKNGDSFAMQKTKRLEYYQGLDSLCKKAGHPSEAEIQVVRGSMDVYKLSAICAIQFIIRYFHGETFPIKNSTDLMLLTKIAQSYGHCIFGSEPDFIRTFCNKTPYIAYKIANSKYSSSTREFFNSFKKVVLQNEFVFKYSTDHGNFIDQAIIMAEEYMEAENRFAQKQLGTQSEKSA